MKRKNLREFDCIRSVTEKIYTYGFYTREEMIQHRIISSPRAYDDIIRQLRDLYYYDIDGENSALKEEPYINGHYKKYKFNRDYFSHAGDTLAAAYGLYAASDDSVAITIRCMSLAASVDGATVVKIAGISEDETGADRKPTISRRLKDLRESKYIVGRKNGNSLSTVLADLTDDELISLYYFASFYAGVGYPRIPSIFLRKALKRHMLFRKLPAPPDAFLFRDNVCGNVFDEQVVYELLCCCQNHRVTEALVRGTNYKLNPVFLKIDTKLGRWYLFAVCGDSPMVIRVSNIKKVKPSSEQFDYMQALQTVNEVYQYTYISGQKALIPVRVEAKLQFESPAMRAQFEREMLVGWIEKREDEEVYCVDAGDATEVKPFLRCYGAYLKILPDNGHLLKTELKQEYERMLSRYGTV